MSTVFHFTSVRRLPSILRDGTLWPTIYDNNELLKAFGQRLVWATTDSEGDQTARPFRYGMKGLARIASPSDIFVTWPELRQRRMAQIQAREDNGEIDEAEVEADAAEATFYWYEHAPFALYGDRSDVTQTWRVHPGSLPLFKAAAIEKRIRGRWLDAS